MLILSAGTDPVFGLPGFSAARYAARIVAGRARSCTGPLHAVDYPITGTENVIRSAANDQELGVALQELPSYLQARGHDTAFIAKVLKEVRPDNVGRAATARERAQQVRQIGHETIKQVRRGFDSGCPATNLMSIEDLRQKYDPEVAFS